MDAITHPPAPINEPNLTYAPGSPERAALELELKRQEDRALDLTATIGGKKKMGGGTETQVVQPHDPGHVLGVLKNSTQADARAAIAAANEAAPGWRALSFDDRAAVLLKAADLLAGPWRQRLNAATMLGQSKTAVQAEIDAACELIDFWRFNVHFARQILAEQPIANSPGVWNRTDHRPLEGFVYAVTPFNFTAIAGNLPTAPALMGNTVVWKPAGTAMLSAYYLMRLLQEAGLPDGVINLVYGSGAEIGDAALSSPHLAGIHFTGSTPVFNGMWRTVASNMDRYRNYPRIVGETGGKDFIVAHPSADVDALATAIVRGSFEYQGQKCSASSRVYAPSNLWPQLRERLQEQVGTIPMGDVSDFRNFMGAVIDGASFKTQADAIEEAKADGDSDIVVGGGYDDSQGYFVQPTVIETRNPDFRTMREELFGPVVTTYVYDESRWDDTLSLIDRSAPYGLTGAVFSEDRAAIDVAQEKLRYAAGNFYVNDKPTGAVVGQQPFGGARASGTNDKAGSMWNLIRWVSPRSIKETFSPPTSYRYPFMDGDR
jgi:1-pyrroline-5-carboxylate dehydrogenase